MSELANGNASFEAKLDNPAESISASLSAISQPSSDVLAGGAGVFFDKITVQVPSGSSVTLSSPPPGATAPSGQLMTPDTIDISGTASSITSGDKPAVQKGDKGSKKISFIFPGPNGAQVPYPVNVTAEVSDAGQTDVVAL